MHTLTTTLSDALTLSSRQLLRLRRYPSLTVLLVAMPLVFLLIFVYVFGGTLGAGVAGGPVGGSGRAAYLDYVTPALVLVAVASAVQGTAITVAMDMTQGITTRLRTMGIDRASMLAAHVIGGMVQVAACVSALVALAVLLGYRPDAGVAGWAGAAGLTALVAFALTWLTVAMGVAAPTVESASNTPMILTLLPFLSSGFVPLESLPAGLRWVAEHQPATPIIDALRGLLADSPDGRTVAVAAAWSVGLAVVGYAWARRGLSARPSG